MPAQALNRVKVAAKEHDLAILAVLVIIAVGSILLPSLKLKS
ncbi:hypothetical protein PFLUOLIPICF7_23665 [Pseudomonas simiae]|nr:hypothetical protein PFLUOLIPICF7_23665 [Pseudomonas simiae]